MAREAGSGGGGSGESLTRLRAIVQGRPASYFRSGTGPPLVFLHGWGLSHRTYEPALERLVRHGLDVLAPTLPGFGSTAPLPRGQESLESYAQWVAEFLEALDVGEAAVVMGHSFGGGVAIKLAHDHPARVRGLVLANSIGGSAWTKDESVVRTMAERPLWDWGLHLRADVLPLPQLTRVLPVITRAALGNLVRNPGAFVRTAAVARTADLTAELDALKRRRLPVVVLWGRDDRIVTEVSNDALCEALGRPERITVDGGHSWMLADPDAFAEVMTNVIPIASRARSREHRPHLHDVEVLARRTGS